MHPCFAPFALDFWPPPLAAATLLCPRDHLPFLHSFSPPRQVDYLTAVGNAYASKAAALRVDRRNKAKVKTDEEVQARVLLFS